MFAALVKPAAFVLNLMSYALKFTAIGILLFLPLAWLAALMLQGAEKQRVFNAKEAYGVDYIAPGFRLLGHVQTCRTASAAVLAGEPAFLPVLEKAEAAADALLPAVDALDLRHREDFKTEDGRYACSERWTSIKDAMAALRGRRFGGQEESFQAYTGLCQLLIDWILNYAANYSNLILDPDLDSYWLMDAYVAKLPQISESLTQACARSLMLRGETAVPLSQRLELHGLGAAATGILDDLQKVNLKTAYAFNDARHGSLRESIDASARLAVARCRAVLDSLQKQVVTAERPSFVPAAMVEESAKASGSVLALYERVGPQLKALIDTRVAGYANEKRLGIAAAGTVSFLYIYLFFALYAAIHSSIARVSGFAQRMIEGTEETFRLEGRDELAQVAESYNRINATLNETRALKSRVESHAVELKASEERFRNLAGGAPVGIFLTDADGGYLYVNRHWCGLAGIDAGRAMKDGWSRALHADDLERVDREWSRAVRSGLEFNAEFRFVRTNGEAVWISAKAVPVRDAAGRIDGLIGSMTDITERVKVERLKTEFISTVSHELRTPLTSIRGSLGLIAGGVTGELPVKARGMIDIAHKNCERLVRLVSDILDVEKIESGKMTFTVRSLELLPLVEQAIEANRGFAQNFRVGLRLAGISPVGVRVMADSDRLAQILTNLISNASKFSPPDESVTLAVARRDGMVRVSVTDRGSGIPEEFRARIFQKFAQADATDRRVKQGTGLGLSICKSIVEKMGGQIGFETAAGAGTTFHFDLVEDVPAKPAVPTRKPGRPTILVCEDEADIATILVSTLDSSGYNVEVASSASQAKDLLARNAYDGMTLDLALPDQDGISLLRELREIPATRDLPIIVVSAYFEEGRRSLNGGAFGVVDWLEKPIDTARLRKALKAASRPAEAGLPRILHVEDDPDIGGVVKAAFAGTADVVTAGSLETARERIRTGRYDLLILDIGLPDGSGLELLPLVRSQLGPSVPVVVFSAQEPSPATSRHVAASLVKSSTSHEDLVGTILSLLEKPAGTLAPART